MSQEEIKKPSIYRINRKLVREIAKLGHKFTTSNGSVGHLLPFVIVRNDELPIDQYQVIDFKDMPDAALANLGLQKIPAKTEEVGSVEIDWDRPQLVRTKDGPQVIVRVVDNFMANPRMFTGIVVSPTPDATPGDEWPRPYPFAKEFFEYHGEISATITETTEKESL